ncbi:MAG: AAA family ATPase [Propionivibrio sp.]
MYLEHFGLREVPFSITPHTEFFFAGANRGNTLEALIYAITHDEGIVKVSGEVGSGKTMLCRMLLEKLPNHVETVYLATPSLSREDILHAIADELKIDLPVLRTHQMMRALQERLLEIYASGRQVVVMIDEAHAMPAETLEEIRLLSNLESNRHKLLHIVLFGQPELDERLSEKGMRQLKDRITHNFALEPLRHGDIGNYLMFRLRAAGYRGPDLFTASAIRLVSKASQGLTRRINILADKGLLSAFADGRHIVDNRQIKAAIRDAQLTPIRNDRSPIAMAGFGIAAVLILAFIAWRIGITPPPLPTAAPESARTEQGIPTLPANAENPPSARAMPHPVTESPASLANASTLTERIAATDEWLKITPDSHYFIQLLSTDGNNLTDVQLFIDSLSSKVDPLQIRVYHSRLSGRNRLGVIYGDYPTREAASEQLPILSAITPAGHPYIRTVSKLK